MRPEPGEDSLLSIPEQRCGAGPPPGERALATDVGFKTFYNPRRVIIGIELAQKIHKRQSAIPITLQSNSAAIWHPVMAA